MGKTKKRRRVRRAHKRSGVLRLYRPGVPDRPTALPTAYTNRVIAATAKACREVIRNDGTNVLASDDGLEMVTAAVLEETVFSSKGRLQDREGVAWVVRAAWARVVKDAERSLKCLGRAVRSRVRLDKPRKPRAGKQRYSPARPRKPIPWGGAIRVPDPSEVALVPLPGIGHAVVTHQNNTGVSCSISAE